jgi:hypothetical protein
MEERMHLNQQIMIANGVTKSAHCLEAKVPRGCNLFRDPGKLAWATGKHPKKCRKQGDTVNDFCLALREAIHALGWIWDTNVPTRRCHHTRYALSSENYAQ